MAKENNDSEEKNSDEFTKLLKKDLMQIPQVGDIVSGTVISASKSEVQLDIEGVRTGVVRGRELYLEAKEYANLKPGDEIEATVIEEENENGELELSFRHAGQQRAWSALIDAYENKKIIKVKVNDANKGGLIVSFVQITGFLPVSQLSPENYPRVNGGDKGKILEKLRSFINKEIEVKIVTLDQQEEKLIVSERDAWQEKQKDIISKYKVGSIVEGTITAITDFGIFVTFGEDLEGLIHISELAWQRIDNPADLFKVGDRIKAEIISIDGSKIFLSAKKLMQDPWKEVAKKYKEGQIVEGKILKVNPFGLFVELDKDIHGLAHISQLSLASGQKIYELYKAGQKQKFTVVSIEPEDHRLGLTVPEGKKEKIESGKHLPVGLAGSADSRKSSSTAISKDSKIKESSVKKEIKPKNKKVKPARNAMQSVAGGEKNDKKNDNKKSNK